MRLVFLTLCIALTGCGPASISTVSLSGTVTLDKTPVKEGVIIFYSDVEGGASVAADIVNGKFDAPKVPKGAYRAAIRSKTVDTKTMQPADSSLGAPSAGPAKPDPIPLQYREPSIPVDASQSNSALNIELKSK